MSVSKKIVSKIAFANHMKQFHDIAIDSIESEEKVDIQDLGWVLTTHTNAVHEKKKKCQSQTIRAMQGKKYRCGMCEVGFNDFQNRNRHITTDYEGNNNKPYSTKKSCRISVS